MTRMADVTCAGLHPGDGRVDDVGVTVARELEGHPIRQDGDHIPGRIPAVRPPLLHDMVPPRADSRVCENMRVAQDIIGPVVALAADEAAVGAGADVDVAHAEPGDRRPYPRRVRLCSHDADRLNIGGDWLGQIGQGHAPGHRVLDRAPGLLLRDVDLQDQFVEHLVVGDLPADTQAWIPRSWSNAGPNVAPREPRPAVPPAPRRGFPR